MLATNYQAVLKGVHEYNTHSCFIKKSQTLILFLQIYKLCKIMKAQNG